MNQVRISTDDHTTSKGFIDGNPVQVRVEVNENDTNYRKGRLVNVIVGNREAEAVIVSDPIVVSLDHDRKSKVLSLIVEQDRSIKQS